MDMTTAERSLSRRERARRLLLTVCLALLAVALLFALLELALILAWNQMHRPFLNKLKQVRPGISEERAIDLLGEPVHVHEALSEPRDWYKVHSNVGHPKWEIENKVLVFHGPADYIVYVHIGSDERVRDVYVGRT
jgi:membrane protein implicated in regulation of membrane protease activity